MFEVSVCDIKTHFGTNTETVATPRGAAGTHTEQSGNVYHSNNIYPTFTLKLLQQFPLNTLSSGTPPLSFCKCHAVLTLNHCVMAKCNKQLSDVKGKADPRTGHESPQQ
jgi:hypothetical protein